MQTNKLSFQIFNSKADNLAKLAELFPSAVKDGQFDITALKEELGQFEEVGSEKYELTWAGKQAAKKLAQTDVAGRTLKYVPEDSKDADTTQNLYIEGDNLEVLKLLRQNYYGAVKMIYIDPPYNTGNDFVYRDKFNGSKIESDEAEGEIENGERMVINQMSSNRFHANWLNMMLPRLRVAKDLLLEDGVVFISIDDGEVENLKKICNEVFNEDNFLGCLILQTATDNNPRQVYIEHEYMLCYAKKKDSLTYWHAPSEKANLILEKYQNLKEKYNEDIKLIQSDLRKWIKANESSLEGVSHYDNVDEKGVFHDGDVANTVFGGYRYEVIHPVTGKVCKIPYKGFRFAESTMREMLLNDEIMFGKDETTLIKPKKRINNAKDVLRSVIYEDGRASTKQFEALMARDIFQNPKSDTVLERLIGFVVQENDVVLDFFSGSATTAEAILSINAAENFNLRFIMVQFPEDLDIALIKSDSRGKKTIQNAISFLDSINKDHFITEIGKERIRRAGNKIKAAVEAVNQQLKLNDETKQVPDIGFRVFRTADTNIRWTHEALKDGQMEIDEAMLSEKDKLDFMPGYTDIDVVYEILLRQRDIPLSAKVEKLPIGVRTYIFADAYVVCLDDTITVELVEQLAAVEPTPIKYVFRDSAFDDNISLKDETIRRLEAYIDRNTGDMKTAYTVEFI